MEARTDTLIGRAIGTRPAAVAFAGVFAACVLAFLGLGAVLPVLPRYVKGPIGSTDIAVGIVTGAFAFTAVVCRPLGGRLADTRGRRIVVVTGALLASAAGLLYFVPAGVAGLVVARLFLGAGEGLVFTAGAAWTVDLAPEETRGRAIGLFGLTIWSALTAGPVIGEVLRQNLGYDAVWAFAAAAPLLGAARGADPARLAARVDSRGSRRAGGPRGAAARALALARRVRSGGVRRLHRAASGPDRRGPRRARVHRVRRGGGGRAGGRGAVARRRRSAQDGGRRRAVRVGGAGDHRPVGGIARRPWPAPWSWASASRCCSRRWR